jgi:hypothetical protein
VKRGIAAWLKNNDSFITYVVYVAQYVSSLKHYTENK